MTYDHVSQQAEWCSPRVGQGALIEDGKVLLSANRWYSDKPLVWTLPGGRAEDGEGVGEAVVREFGEETGLVVEVVDLAFVAEARSRERRQLFITCAFTVKRISGTLNCAGDAVVEELRFVPFGELGIYLPSPSLGDPLRWHIERPGAGARYWYFPEY